MTRLVGWFAVLLALISLAPSFVPGAMSVIGLSISLLSLAISVLSVRRVGQKFFRATLAIVLFGALLVNAVLRVWLPMGAPIEVTMSLYGALCLVVVGCIAVVNRIARDEKRPL